MSDEVSYRVGPRGLGTGDSPGCICCDKGPGLYPNLAMFVETREIGEKVVALFRSGAYLDYRDWEPHWIQVKIGVCQNHFSNLGKLYSSLTEIGRQEGSCLLSSSLLKSCGILTRE